MPTYLISPFGMTEVPISSSAIWFDDVLYSIPGSDVPPTHIPSIVSEIIDFGYRGQKTIFSIEMGTSEVEGAEVALDWRMKITEDFQRTTFVPLNDLGAAVLIVSGVEFRLCMKFSSFLPLISSLDYAKIRWKMTDLRGLRGVYAAPPRGQSYAH